MKARADTITVKISEKQVQRHILLLKIVGVIVISVLVIDLYFTLKGYTSVEECVRHIVQLLAAIGIWWFLLRRLKALLVKKANVKRETKL